MDFALCRIALTFERQIACRGMGDLAWRLAMWRRVQLSLGICVVTLSLGLTVGSLYGQDSIQGDTSRSTTLVRDDDDGFDFSWIGLIGLVGLAGLMPRDQRNRNGQQING